MPLPDCDVVGVEFNGAFVFRLGSRPIPVIRGEIVCQNCVRFCQVAVNGKRFVRHGLRLGNGFVCGHDSIITDHVVGVCQSAVSQGVIRIDGDGLIEIVNALFQALLIALLPIVAAEKIGIVGGGVGLRAGRLRLVVFWAKLHLDLTRDVAGHVVLK